ncbi:MAG: type II toxin-antitoxin system RelE/ParE family toxin [Akkermansiaceae bacterium]|nr:type II toxin-antitoxin system RelE/ParE family toxin [Akkermansiaceae bacterium]
MTLIWNEEAEEEFWSASVYYDDQEEGLGDRFVTTIQATLAKILANPGTPRCFDEGCRRVRTERFPYFVIYCVEGEQVQIASVMHTSRRPGYWKNRL